MREIKFRAWDGEEIRYEFSVQANGDGVNYSGGIVGWPLMQFTGLHDKNGKEIYEGDVVFHHYKWDDKDNREQFEGVGKEWEPGRAIVENRGWSFFFYQISGGQWRFNGPENEEWEENKLEVIGNIYENPELLTTPTGGKTDNNEMD